MCICVLVHSHNDQRATGSGSSIFWVLEINLGSSGWAASAFTLWAILPVCWVFNVTLLMKIVITTAILESYWENDTIFLRRTSRNLPRSGCTLALQTGPEDWPFRIQDEFGVGFVLRLKNNGQILEGWMLASIQRDQTQHETQGFQAADSGFIQIQLISFWSLRTCSSQPQQITWRDIWRNRSSPRSLGLLLSSAGDLFPLTIPRWRWGMRILQGNSSTPLDNSPIPGDFSETLCWTQQGR